MIPTTLKWIGLLVVCLLVQGTIGHAITIAGTCPDFVLVGLFMVAIRNGPMAAILGGFVLGLTQDLYAPSILGQNALAQTLTGAFIGIFNDKVMRTDAWMKAVILLSAFVIHDTIYLVTGIAKEHGSYSALPVELLVRTLPNAVYSVAVVGVFFLWDSLLKPNLRK